MKQDYHFEELEDLREALLNKLEHHLTKYQLNRIHAGKVVSFPWTCPTTSYVYLIKVRVY